jgi:hypothetical protein
VATNAFSMKGRGTDEEKAFVQPTGLQGLQPRFEGERGHFTLQTMQNTVPDLGGKGQFGVRQSVRGALGFSGGWGGVRTDPKRFNFNGPSYSAQLTTPFGWSAKLKFAYPHVKEI